MFLGYILLLMWGIYGNVNKSLCVVSEKKLVIPNDDETCHYIQNSVTTIDIETACKTISFPALIKTSKIPTSFIFQNNISELYTGVVEYPVTKLTKVTRISKMLKINQLSYIYIPKQHKFKYFLFVNNCKIKLYYTLYGVVFAISMIIIISAVVCNKLKCCMKPKMSNISLSNIIVEAGVNLQCPICLCPILENGVSTECNHSFHKKCILEWYSIQKTCPICRQKD